MSNMFFQIQTWIWVFLHFLSKAVLLMQAACLFKTIVTVN